MGKPGRVSTFVRSHILFLPALALLLGSVSYGQQTEVSVSGGVSRLQNSSLGYDGSSGTALKLDDGFRLAFRMTLNPYAHFGHEFGYAYSRTGFLTGDGSQASARTAIHQGGYAFLAYATREGSRIRPFAAGGGHFSNFVYPGYSGLSGGGQAKIGVNYGGGVKFRIGEMWMLRVDARQYLTGKPFGYPGVSGALRQNELSIGFGIGL